MDTENNTSVSDLERFKETALTPRELAWELLKVTRNPEYVALRYGYPISTMREALAKIPKEEPAFKKLSRPGYGKATEQHRNGYGKSAAELAREAMPSREPGEDDDL